MARARNTAAHPAAGRSARKSATTPRSRPGEQVDVRGAARPEVAGDQGTEGTFEALLVDVAGARSTISSSPSRQGRRITAGPGPAPTFCRPPRSPESRRPTEPKSSRPSRPSASSMRLPGCGSAWKTPPIMTWSSRHRSSDRASRSRSGDGAVSSGLPSSRDITRTRSVDSALWTVGSTTSGPGSGGHGSDVAGLDGEVQLFGQCRGEPVGEFGDAERARPVRPFLQGRGDAADDVDVTLGLLPHAGPLDLHDDVLAAAQPCFVDLRDRRRGQGFRVELGEDVVGRAAELGLQHRPDGVGAGGGDLVRSLPSPRRTPGAAGPSVSKGAGRASRTSRRPSSSARRSERASLACRPGARPGSARLG